MHGMISGAVDEFAWTSAPCADSRPELVSRLPGGGPMCSAMSAGEEPARPTTGVPADGLCSEAVTF